MEKLEKDKESVEKQRKNLEEGNKAILIARN